MLSFYENQLTSANAGRSTQRVKLTNTDRAQVFMVRDCRGQFIELQPGQACEAELFTDTIKTLQPSRQMIEKYDGRGGWRMAEPPAFPITVELL